MRLGAKSRQRKNKCTSRSVGVWGRSLYKASLQEIRPSVPIHSVPSTIRPPTKRPRTIRPLYKASPPQSVPATKHPLYKASPLQNIPSTKRPHYKASPHEKNIGVKINLKIILYNFYIKKIIRENPLQNLKVG